MDIFKGIEQLPDMSSGSAVAIGNFDGMHLGHQEILQSLVKQGKKQNLSAFVLTFSSHPRKVLGENSLDLIQTHEQRLDDIKKYAVQGILILTFDKVLSSQPAEQFIDRILIDSLHARVVIVGENFHFGKKREGNVEFLKKISARSGFRVISVPSVIIDGINISSSYIRQLLKTGEIEKASRFLGHPYSVCGTVVKGDSIGKALGFPTANIITPNEILPPGVFITQTQIGLKKYPSLTNVGIRPTFHHRGEHIESFLINFKNDLYGRIVNVSFLKKIRDERKFESPEALTEQIQRDLQTAKDYFQI